MFRSIPNAMSNAMLFTALVHAACAAHAAAPVPAQSQDAATRAQAAAEVLEAIAVDRTVRPVALRMAGFIAEQIAQWQVTPAQQPDVNAAMTKIQDLLLAEMSWRSVAKDYVSVYSETFSTAELQDIAAFFKTSTGQKYIATVPALQEKALVIGEQHLAAIQPQIQLILEDLQRHLLATAPPDKPPQQKAAAADPDAAAAPNTTPDAARTDALMEAERGGRAH